MIGVAISDANPGGQRGGVNLQTEPSLDLVPRPCRISTRKGNMRIDPSVFACNLKTSAIKLAYLAYSPNWACWVPSMEIPALADAKRVSVSELAN